MKKMRPSRKLFLLISLPLIGSLLFPPYTYSYTPVNSHLRTPATTAGDGFGKKIAEELRAEELKQSAARDGGAKSPVVYHYTPPFEDAEQGHVGTFSILFDKASGLLHLLDKRERQTTSDHSEFYRGTDTLILKSSPTETVVESRTHNEYYTRSNEDHRQKATLPGQHVISVRSQGAGTDAHGWARQHQSCRTQEADHGL